MKRTLALCLYVVVGLFTFPAWAQKTTTLRFSNFAGPTTFLTTGVFQPLVEKIEQDAQGSLKIQMFSGGTLVKAEDAFDAVRRGLVDMAWGLTGYTPGRFKVGSISEIPFKVGSIREGSRGVWALYEHGLMDGFDDVYVFGLASSAVGRMNVVKEVKGLEDLKGERVRAGGALTSAAFEALGFTPVGIPVSHAAESLSKRVIVGTSNDWVALQAWQILDLVPYHVDVPLGAATAYVVINQKKFDALPEQAKQALIQNGGIQFVEFWSATLEAENRRTRAKILENPKHVLITPSAEQLASYEQSVQGVVDEWIDTIPNGKEVWEVYGGAIDAVRNETKL